MEEHRKLAIEIIDKFAELLDKYNIKLPSDEREGNIEESAIYGNDYFDLEDEITDILEEFVRNKDVKISIFEESIFRLCNGHTFEEIKAGNMDELDYNKAYDLALLENEKHSVSVYLGVYDGEFELTYSIHAKNNFNCVFENSDAESIEMGNINNAEELEKIMKIKLAEYFIENEKYIENYSKELAKIDIIEYTEVEEEL